MGDLGRLRYALGYPSDAVPAMDVACRTTDLLAWQAPEKPLQELLNARLGTHP